MTTELRDRERGSLYIPDKGMALPGFGTLFNAPDHSKQSKIAGYDKHGRAIPAVMGGAWSVSGLFLLNWIDILDATQMAIDLSLTTHKWALYNNTETPNYSTQVGYSATNEVSGTGYTAAGKVITSPTLTESPAGTMMYDMADEVWGSPTTVTAYGAKLYQDALAGDNLIVGVNFAGAYTSTNGIFTIQFATLGVFTIDLTP